MNALTIFLSVILLCLYQSGVESNFTCTHTAADGVTIIGFQGKTNSDDGRWEATVDGVAIITVGLEKIILQKGASLLFNYVPILVTTIGFVGESITADGDFSVTIERTGDTSTVASVIVYTEDGAATAGTDYVGRPNNENSRVEFGVGESTADIPIDLLRFDGERIFVLRLAEAVGAEISQDFFTFAITVTG